MAPNPTDRTQAESESFSCNTHQVIPCDSDDIERLIEFVQQFVALEMDSVKSENVLRTQNAQEESLGIAEKLNCPGPRHPTPPFVYAEKLKNFSFSSSGSVAGGTNGILSTLIQGALRPQSPNFLLNICPDPIPIATVASCWAIYHNINGIMDSYGGESLLTEQMVARELGSWVGWDNAGGTVDAGGKHTMVYALRLALARTIPDYLRSGVCKDSIIIVSEGAHYSLAHAATIVGIGTSACWPVPMDADNAMDIEALRRRLHQAWETDLIVSAVICCAGSTIDCHCDDLKQVRDTVLDVLAEYPGKPVPLLHADAVIGWQYLSLEETTLISELENCQSRAGTRISSMRHLLVGLHDFDTFGVDFHKNGLAPVGASFFVSKDDSFMNTLSLERTGDLGSLSFGQHRAYRYTLENSRDLHGVAGAAAVLTDLGRSGIAQYLVDLQNTRDHFEDAVHSSVYFECPERTSLGWEILVRLFHPNNEGKSGVTAPSQEVCGFVDWLSDLTFEGLNVPLVGKLSDAKETFVLLYPMKAYSRKQTADIISYLEELWLYYLRQGFTKSLHFSDEAVPIR